MTKFLLLKITGFVSSKRSNFQEMFWTEDTDYIKQGKLNMEKAISFDSVSPNRDILNEQMVGGSSSSYRVYIWVTWSRKLQVSPIFQVLLSFFSLLLSLPLQMNYKIAYEFKSTLCLFQLIRVLSLVLRTSELPCLVTNTGNKAGKLGRDYLYIKKTILVSF